MSPGLPPAAQVVERLLAVDGAFDPIALVAKRLGQGLPHVEVILDEQDREIPHAQDFT